MAQNQTLQEILIAQNTIVVLSPQKFSVAQTFRCQVLSGFFKRFIDNFNKLLGQLWNLVQYVAVPS
jgi:hypothetical protein